MKKHILILTNCFPTLAVTICTELAEAIWTRAVEAPRSVNAAKHTTGDYFRQQALVNIRKDV